MDVRVQCADCGEPFRFHGLPLGSSYVNASMSVDGLEARLPVTPASSSPNPIQEALHGGEGGIH
jgi:hypothetical protein